MKKIIFFILILSLYRINSFAVVQSNQDPRKNIWVFILAGQSNMAGRAKIEPQDTVTNKRILLMNSNGKIAIAKEPLHSYEPDMAGLDCGLSFGNMLLKNVPDSVSILLVPAAVGGSSIDQWLGDSLHRGVKLFTNFTQLVKMCGQYGQLKAILWHQGESDANPKKALFYQKKLQNLFAKFRSETDNLKLPILTASIGTFKLQNTDQKLINKAIKDNAIEDPNTFLIKTDDLSDRGDELHYDSKSQRKMGKRFAKMYKRILKNKRNII
ncbi:sialate O-acetylesterase [Pedobacter psychrodurus]|uniref:Sialate O-acetylesterase n=1 Tax=Pedobacter psychrodurus TaxID=2530456 RepID=A0A4R0PYX7_9SPHI|nr:sialate O-acetylesterase [Pedobacter psychrodurus]TCD28340.1 sialate O-acetylesterase [Pedobacter psychrodurus]